MAAHVIPDNPGADLPAADGGIGRPVQVPVLDDATVRLLMRNVLIGGEPGGGKSVPFYRAAAQAATSLTDDLAAVFDGPGK